MFCRPSLGSMSSFYLFTFMLLDSWIFYAFYALIAPRAGRVWLFARLVSLLFNRLWWTIFEVFVPQVSRIHYFFYGSLRICIHDYGLHVRIRPFVCFLSIWPSSSTTKVCSTESEGWLYWTLGRCSLILNKYRLCACSKVLSHQACLHLPIILPQNLVS